MQLDADGEDQPFFKPQIPQTEPLIPRTGPGRNNTQIVESQDNQQSQQSTDGEEQDLGSSIASTAEDPGVHDVAARVAAAAITAEQNE